MYRTVLHGFDQDLEQSIFSLVDKNILDIRCWIKESNESSKDKDYFIDIQSLFFNSFFLKNKDKTEYYSSGIKFDRENYDLIFQKIFKFMEYHSRHSVWIDGYLNTNDGFYMFNAFYRFIYGLFCKEEINFILFVNIPHEGADLIIYEIAKSLNIKMLIFNQFHMKPYTSFYMTDINDYGIFNYMLNNDNDNDNDNDIDFIKIEKKLEIPNYMYVPSRYFNDTDDLSKKIKKEIKKIKKSNTDYLKYLIIIYNETKTYNKNLKENIKHVNYNEKFVYFPLHMQPELSTSALGDIFTDQLLAIEILSEIIPDDWKIVVKENPKQGYYARSQAFFNIFKTIKKAILCPLDENSFELIQKCQFVATITGTAGFESLKLGKPLLTFGLAWYNFLPGVFKYNKNFNLDDLLNYKINHSELELYFNKIIKKTLNVIMDYSYKDDILNFNEDENNKKIASFIESQIDKLFKNDKNRT